MTSLGAPHTYVAWMSASEASGLLLLGDWRACEKRLRVVLGSTPGPMGDVQARLTAALLSCWQGRQTEAHAHLARADELFAEQSSFLAFHFDAVRAELAIAAGDPEHAFSAALAGVSGPPPTFAERLIPLPLGPPQTRLKQCATAERIRRAPWNGCMTSRAATRLLSKMLGPDRCTKPSSEPCRPGTTPRSCGGCEIQTPQCVDSRAAACAEGDLAWDEAYAQWRAAEALLQDRSARVTAMRALRRAHELAVGLQAVPLRMQVEALAGAARVPLAIPRRSVDESVVTLPTLTPREREVLAYVVAGRTYGEIACELVISEKTVSAHISNLLHKTGTSSRLELAQLARTSYLRAA